MLIGSYQHNLDAKGRLFIPAKWREDLGDTFIVTRGISGCFLMGMPLGEWKNISEKLSQIAYSNKSGQAVSRAIHAAATDVEIDKQGRILLNQRLRDIAKLGDAGVLIGKTTHIEIWNADIIEQLESEENFEKAMEAFEEFGI